MYYQVRLNLSETQKKKLHQAVQSNQSVSIRITDFKEGKDVLALTNTQCKKLSKASPVTIKLSPTQLQYNVKGGFLPLLAAVLPFLAKTLGVGALSGLASTAVSKVLGNGLYLKKGGCVCKIETDGKGVYLGSAVGSGLESKGDGLYLKKGGMITDGKGLLLGDSSPFKNIPILGMLL